MLCGWDYEDVCNLGVVGATSGLPLSGGRDGRCSCRHFARALMVYWMESIAVVLSEGMTCESPPEVVVGLPCFCPFVTVAGRGGLSQAALGGCRGLGQLGLRAC